MQVEDMEGKIIPGFGRCIYCGSDGGTEGLRDEHIMPFCLGGTAVIEKASCRNCEAITSRLDGYLGRRTFYELRIHTELKRVAAAGHTIGSHTWSQFERERQVCPDNTMRNDAKTTLKFNFTRRGAEHAADLASKR